MFNINVWLLALVDTQPLAATCAGVVAGRVACHALALLLVALNVPCPLLLLFHSGNVHANIGGVFTDTGATSEICLPRHGNANAESESTPTTHKIATKPKAIFLT